MRRSSPKWYDPLGPPFFCELVLMVLGVFFLHFQASGFSDPAPAMRELSIKSMLLFAPKLSEKVMNNDLLRYFAKLQMDEEPGIRTNTTICMGKIAEYMNTAVNFFSFIFSSFFCTRSTMPSSFYPDSEARTCSGLYESNS